MLLITTTCTGKFNCFVNNFCHWSLCCNRKYANGNSSWSAERKVNEIDYLRSDCALSCKCCTSFHAAKDRIDCSCCYL